MNVSLYQAAAALDANSRWQDVISENLASSAASGFRKQTLTTAAVQAGLMPLNSSNGPFSSEYFSLPKTSVSVSFKSGELDYTGNDKNIAIEGAGFFEAELANGTSVVTRDGEFQVNTKGELVTKEGYIVQGDGGPIKLDPHNHSPISVNADGSIKQDGVSKGKLSVVDFENPELLEQTNGVYFISTNSRLRRKPAEATLRQGFIEGANTTALGEMANMMTAMRTFEANQHVIQIQDDRLKQVITDLGNTANG